MAPRDRTPSTDLTDRTDRTDLTDTHVHFMEKRVIVFLILSLLIVVGWNFLAGKMGWIPEPPPKEGQEAPLPTEPHAKPAQSIDADGPALAKEQPASADEG